MANLVKLVPYSDSENETDNEDNIPLAILFNVRQHNDVIALAPVETVCSRPRKRKVNTEKWKSVIRKTAHDAGLEYVSVRNKVVPAKKVKTLKNCLSCIFKCHRLITDEERTNIFQHFYTLKEHEKKMFIISTTEKVLVQRHTKKRTSESSRRKYTYFYFLKVGNSKIQVCKKFYLGTLSISEKKVFGAHLKKQAVSNIPLPSLQGKHRKRYISDNQVEFVKAHIKSFHPIESHYCRSTTKRQFLDPSLNIKKMYRLYLDLCREKDQAAVKESFYRNIFRTQFNLSFHARRKDRCDLCEEIETLRKNNVIDHERNERYRKHIQEKVVSREERNRDRNDKTKAVLCFDLENVLSCPRAEVSNFYYKSKFSVYNLTAHLSITKQVYCAIWNESQMGRSGNEIASALLKILQAVYSDNPNLKNLILWSDSCIPQNKNSLMSYAISYFLYKHPEISTITMKFSTPGHSTIQEIDNVHSCIEKVLAKAEYYSPVSLLALLKKVATRRPYTILEMESNDFFDLKSCCSYYNYKIIPFSKISALKFTTSIFNVQYKLSHNPENEWKVETVRNYNATRQPFHVDMKKPSVSSKSTELSKEKIAAIKSMIRWMPKKDQDYFINMLNK